MLNSQYLEVLQLTSFYEYLYINYTYIILTAFFQVKLGLTRGPMIFLTRGFGIKFYRLDALPHTNQQKHTRFHLFCIL